MIKSIKLIRRSRKAQVYLTISILMNVIGFSLNLVNSERLNNIGILMVFSTIFILVLAILNGFLTSNGDDRAALGQVFFISGVCLIINPLLIAILTK